ncbi:MAG: AraC family transcriptional regulator [Planctomycetes bacterium]|nr:AraC family transcriptional regulator [Planctomycetota bacterium]
MAENRHHYSMLPSDKGFTASSDSSIEIFLNLRQAYTITPHSHPHFELIYIINGKRNVIINDRKNRAGPGDLLVYRPNEVHEESMGSKTLSYVVMRFNPQALSEARVQFPPLERIGPVVHLPNKSNFLELFRRMIQEKENPAEGSDLIMGAYLVEFVVMLRRAIEKALGEKEPANATRSTRIRTAVETIQDNLTRDINLEQLAQNAFMSKSHFSHIFKEETGESPKGYLIKERIAKAKELLSQTDKSAQDIAHALGYESPYFFYRQFKQKTGMTTAEYREKSKKA